jgi:hypothetical protein
MVVWGHESRALPSVAGFLLAIVSVRAANRSMLAAPSLGLSQQIYLQTFRAAED